MKKQLLITCTALVLLVLMAGQAQAAITNPIGSEDMTVGDLFLRIVRTFLGIVASIAAIYFIYGGAMMMTSAGNAEKVQKAKSSMLYAILGLVLVFTSWQIIIFVIEALSG